MDTASTKVELMEPTLGETKQLEAKEYPLNSAQISLESLMADKDLEADAGAQAAANDLRNLFDVLDLVGHLDCVQLDTSLARRWITIPV